MKGQAQNPARFLAQQREGSPFGPFETKGTRTTASTARVDVKALAQAAADAK